MKFPVLASVDEDWLGDEVLPGETWFEVALLEDDVVAARLLGQI